MPDSGELACGYVGEGKLASVEDIVARALALLGLATEGRPLAGRRVLVTAGPTHEAIDPVRYIANASSGKMGFAIAREAARRGARVTLVAGPCELPTPAGVDRVDVVSARQMHDAALSSFSDADVAICAAAVADYTPAEPADHKLKKAHEHLDSIRLVETADILAELSAAKGARKVVGFAAETHDLMANAQAKLARKGCDMIVANDVSRADSTFGSDTDRVAFVYADHVEQLDTLPLASVASELLDRVGTLLEAGA
jgi:phosphopantothenoylcysteine decarboxylase/phosphopantothenate--cysteine ligase